MHADVSQLRSALLEQFGLSRLRTVGFKDEQIGAIGRGLVDNLFNLAAKVGLQQCRVGNPAGTVKARIELDDVGKEVTYDLAPSRDRLGRRAGIFRLAPSLHGQCEMHHSSRDFFSGAGIFTPASGRAIDPAEYQGSMRHQQVVLDHLFDRQLIRP
jgi:hypothetical protein